MAKPEKLTCHVTTEMKLAIQQLGIQIHPKKGGLGKAYRRLIDYAVTYMDHPIREFEGDQDSPCSMDAKTEELESLQPYQAKHGIGTRSEAFRSAIYRGLSYYLDNKVDGAPPPVGSNKSSSGK